jgi:hypothetical protein
LQQLELLLLLLLHACMVLAAIFFLCSLCFHTFQIVHVAHSGLSLCLAAYFLQPHLFQLNLSPYPVSLILAASDGTQQGQSFNSTKRRPCGSGFVADAV